MMLRTGLLRRWLHGCSRHILKLVSQIKNLHQYSSTTRPTINATDSDESDFSEEEEELQKVEEQEEEEYLVPDRQPVQDANIQDLQARPPYPTPRNQSKAKDETFDNPDAIYLEPIQPKPQLPPTCPLSKLPFIATKGPNMIRNISYELIPPPSEGGPAPSFHKKVSKDSQPQPQKTKIVHRPYVPERNNSPIGASEDGKGGAMGISFLHRLHQENKPAPLPKIPKPWILPSSQEKNEHEYECVDNPLASCGGPEFPGSAVPDFDDDWNRQLGAATLPQKKQSSVSRNHLGGTDSRLASGSLQRVPHNRPPMPTNEFAPSLPYVILDNGKTLDLTPLYKKLLEKPYFHLISRHKAENLIMPGEDGIFLIRPSTKSGHPLTLVLSLEKHPYNINIRQRPDSLFALGKEKTQEKAFSSLDELVNTYSREPIKLENGKKAFLKHTPPKKGNSYVKHHPPGLAKKY
ncbi:uncharacterized protein LOC123518322 isoform X2 [Portunus trituberculatus]|uniref:uncharacterized protein LOC123518322 isoform X2 n=1 Tax=Portunus trituberculatus TaxID=210409 RepID=UPI001E1CDC1E|nr:uncharacterized protein LOC123518322 isoform X2 [Portunus trituberculatus]